MGDYDRDREPERTPDTDRTDREPERIRETDRTTTVVHTDGGGRRGGGGVLLAVGLIVALLVVLFFLFGGNLNRAADEVGVNVDVDAPKVEMPDVELKVPDKIDVEVPDVEVKADGDGNKAE
jgi:hypothetical protein